MLFSIMAQKIQMDYTYTYTCIFEHISSCSITHMSTTHPSTNMCRLYIYMTAVNLHRYRCNLRKTGVLKLLQDKNQLLIKTQTPVIVLTYSLTNLQKYLNAAFFLKLQWCTFWKNTWKWFFIECEVPCLKHHNFWSRYPIEVKKKAIKRSDCRL